MSPAVSDLAALHSHTRLTQPPAPLNAVVCAGITSATLVVGDGNGPGPAFTLKAMGKHTSVSDLQLLLNSRSDYSHIQDTFGSLKQLPLLKRLQLQFLMSNTPKKGIWPVFFSDSLDAQQIDSINVQSPAMPTITLVVSAPCFLAVRSHMVWVQQTRHVSRRESAFLCVHQSTQLFARQCTLRLAQQLSV